MTDVPTKFDESEQEIQKWIHYMDKLYPKMYPDITDTNRFYIAEHLQWYKERLLERKYHASNSQLLRQQEWKKIDDRNPVNTIPGKYGEFAATWLYSKKGCTVQLVDSYTDQVNNHTDLVLTHPRWDSARQITVQVKTTKSLTFFIDSEWIHKWLGCTSLEKLKTHKLPYDRLCLANEYELVWGDSVLMREVLITGDDSFLNQRITLEELYKRLQKDFKSLDGTRFERFKVLDPSVD